MNAALKAGAPLLRVTDLAVQYREHRHALQGISLELGKGGALGICGESGSGKSTLVRALLGLVPIAQGEIHWYGRSMATFGGKEWRALRRTVQPVFQDPLASLDPRMRVREILAEPLRVHRRELGARVREQRISLLLARVGLTAVVLSRYPHELSGGQCQRICIARAMLLEPAILVCDEPVSALDVSIQAQILAVLQALHRESGTALIFVSHNLALVRRLCSQVMVLRGGAVVEAGLTQEVLDNPQHSYTRQLIAAVPVVPRRAAGGERRAMSNGQ